MQDELPVKRRSVDDKLNETDPPLAETLLRESAARMAAVVDELDAALPPLILRLAARVIPHLSAQVAPQAQKAVPECIASPARVRQAGSVVR